MGPQTVALALAPPPPQDSRQPCPGGYSVSRGGRGVQSCSGRGPRTGWGEDPCTGTWGLEGVENPGSGPNRNDAIAPASPEGTGPRPSAPSPGGAAPGAAESGARLRGTDGCGRSRARCPRTGVRGRRLRLEAAGPVPPGRRRPPHLPAPPPPARAPPANEEVGRRGRKPSRAQGLRRPVRF